MSYYIIKCYVFVVPRGHMSHSLSIKVDDYWHRQLVDGFFYFYYSSVTLLLLLLITFHLVNFWCVFIVVLYGRPLNLEFILVLLLCIEHNVFLPPFYDKLLSYRQITHGGGGGIQSRKQSFRNVLNTYYIVKTVHKGIGQVVSCCPQLQSVQCIQIPTLRLWELY